MAKKRMTAAQMKRLREQFLVVADELPSEKKYIFETTFQRYEELIRRADELEKILSADGVMLIGYNSQGFRVEKINPALAAYNQTAGAADKAAQLILRYVIPKEKEKGGDDTPPKDAFEAF